MRAKRADSQFSVGLRASVMKFYERQARFVGVSADDSDMNLATFVTPAARFAGAKSVQGNDPACPVENGQATTGRKEKNDERPHQR